MREKEIVFHAIERMKRAYNSMPLQKCDFNFYRDVAFELFISCVVDKSLDAVKMSKFLLGVEPNSFESIIEALSEFPEFKEVNKEIEKLKILL